MVPNRVEKREIQKLIFFQEKKSSWDIHLSITTLFPSIAASFFLFFLLQLIELLSLLNSCSLLSPGFFILFYSSSPRSPPTSPLPNMQQSQELLLTSLCPTNIPRAPKMFAIICERKFQRPMKDIVSRTEVIQGLVSIKGWWTCNCFSIKYFMQNWSDSRSF